MDVVPLTPTVVDCVTFDRAPLGRRGYNEDQVDDFLDRVQATLAGKDNLTAQHVRDVVFDPAAFIRRGYHEDQVDEFLDLVVEELDRRSGNPRQAPVPVARTGSPTAPVPPFTAVAPTHLRQTPPPGATEQTAPMLFSLPPSMPPPSTQPVKRDEQAASGPPESTLPAPTDNSAPSGPVVHTPPPAAPVPTNGKSATPPNPADAAPPTNGSPVAAPAEPTPATDAEPVEATTSTEAKDTTEPSLQTATAPQPSATEQTAALPATPADAHPEPAQSPDAEPPSTPATHSTTEPPADASPPAAASANETPQQSASSKAREFEPEAWRDSDHLALPLPPAPPGERGYRPGDVERLMKLLAAMLADPSSPGPDEFANLKLSRTFFVGQGYHAGAVDTLRKAWLDELTRRAL